MTLPADFGRSLSEPKQKQKLNSKSKPTRTAEQKAARKQATDAKKVAKLEEGRQRPAFREADAKRATNPSADMSTNVFAVAFAKMEDQLAASMREAQERADAIKAADVSAVAVAKVEAEEAPLSLVEEMEAHLAHRDAMDSINDRERRALSALDAKRRSPGGRAVEFFMGKRHFEAQRTGIMQRFEAERMTQRRAFASIDELTSPQHAPEHGP